MVSFARPLAAPRCDRLGKNTKSWSVSAGSVVDRRLGCGLHELEVPLVCLSSDISALWRWRRHVGVGLPCLQAWAHTCIVNGRGACARLAHNRSGTYLSQGGLGAATVARSFLVMYLANVVDHHASFSVATKAFRKSSVPRGVVAELRNTSVISTTRVSTTRVASWCAGFGSKTEGPQRSHNDRANPAQSACHDALEVMLRVPRRLGTLGGQFYIGAREVAEGVVNRAVQRSELGFVTPACLLTALSSRFGGHNLHPLGQKHTRCMPHLPWPHPNQMNHVAMQFCGPQCRPDSTNT